MTNKVTINQKHDAELFGDLIPANEVRELVASMANETPFDEQALRGLVQDAFGEEMPDEPEGEN